MSRRKSRTRAILTSARTDAPLVICKTAINRENPTIPFAKTTDWVLAIHYQFPEEFFIRVETRRFRGTYDHARMMLRSFQRDLAARFSTCEGR